MHAIFYDTNKELRKSEVSSFLNTQDIGKFLKESRQLKKLTQLDVARKLEVTPQAVSKWERSECLPDITLLPQIAQIYDVRIEDILAPNAVDDQADYNEIMNVLGRFVDKQLFLRIEKEFLQAREAQDISVPIDIFMFLSQSQKDRLLDILFDKDDYEIILNEIIQYINITQKIKVVRKIIQKKDYGHLEALIPFMTKNIKTEILENLLNYHQFEYIENMLPFLNHEQKNRIIEYIFHQKLSWDVLENFIPFFDTGQRKLIETWSRKE